MEIQWSLVYKEPPFWIWPIVLSIVFTEIDGLSFLQSAFWYARLYCNILLTDNFKWRKMLNYACQITLISGFWKHVFKPCNTLDYNISRACLPDRSPVLAMDLKSNISELWSHMLETCRRLRRLCRKRSNNVTRHDKTPVKSTLLSHDMSFIMLWLLYI